MPREDKIVQLWRSCMTYRHGDVVAAHAMFSAALDLAAIWQRNGREVKRAL